VFLHWSTPFNLMHRNVRWSRSSSAEWAFASEDQVSKHNHRISIS